MSVNPSENKQNEKPIWDGESVTLTEEECRNGILLWTDFDRMECTAPADQADNYRRMVFHGVNHDYTEALEVLGYASLHGNSVFPQDADKAEYCFSRLIETQDNPSPFYYNALGDICYQGLNNDQTPQYEQAFRYYSIASIHGLHSATYRLADMLIDGRGVPKNPEAAFLLVKRIYEQELEHLENEDFSCAFSEAAIRLAGMVEVGLGTKKDPEEACSLYLQAGYALRERMKLRPSGEDELMDTAVSAALYRLEGELPEDFFGSSVRSDSPYMIGTLLQYSEAGIDIALLEKDGDPYIVARLVDVDLTDNEEPRKHLFTVPALRFCAVLGTIMMRIEEPQEIRVMYEEQHACINHISYEREENSWNFSYLDVPRLSVRCGAFSFDV